MKRFAIAAALTGLISVTTLAGNIPTGDFVPPPPPPSQSATTSTALANVVFTIITLIAR